VLLSFSKNHRFRIFQRKKRKKRDCFGYVKKIRIKEPAGSGYFKTLKEPSVFMKELLVLSWDEERLSMNEI